MDAREKQQAVALELYSPQWPAKFQLEAEKIAKQLGDNCLLVEHIGSTSIPALVAKPIIDVLVVVKDLSLTDLPQHCLEALDYIAMGEYGIPGRRFFWKTPEKRSFNVHLFEKGSSEITRYLSFRNYLRKNKDVAESYGAIKLALSKQFPTDIEGYVDGKTSFVRAIDYRTGAAKKDQLSAQDGVTLEAYNPRWPKLAAAELEAIKRMIAQPYESIHHLGSTAIPGMCAKPILDIFIGVTSMKDVDDWIKPLKDLGYIDWPDNPDKTHARYFKGMPPYGVARTHHVHIMAVGDQLDKRILFRDRLRESEQLSKEYLELKRRLVNDYPNDRERYTSEKGEFVCQVVSSC